MLADIYLTWQSVRALCRRRHRSANRSRLWAMTSRSYEFADNFGIDRRDKPRSDIHGRIFRKHPIRLLGWQKPGFMAIRPSWAPETREWSQDHTDGTQPTAEFMEQWEEGDLRKDVTVLYDGCPAFDGTEYQEIVVQYGLKRPQISRLEELFARIQHESRRFHRLPLCRRATHEGRGAQRTGLTDEACTPLNIVRTRAGLPSIPARAARRTKCAN